MKTMLNLTSAGFLGVLLVLLSSEAVHGEGHCMFPMWGRDRLFVVDVKTGKSKEILHQLGMRSLNGPVIFKGVIYTGEPDNLAAVDAATGKTLWITQPGFSGTIIPTEEALYCDGYPRALDPKTGKALWMSKSRSGSSNLLLTGDLVIASKGTGFTLEAVRALDRKTGKERWQVPLKGGPFALTRVTDRIFVSRPDEFHLLDLKTGRTLWQDRCDWPPRPEFPSMYAHPNHFECDQQHLYRLKPPTDPADPGQIEAMDITTKKVRWQTRLPARIDWYASLRVVTNMLFLGTKDELYAFRTDNGKLQWQMTGVDVPYVGDAGKVYVVDHREGIRAVDRNSGKLVWRFDGQSGKVGTRSFATIALTGDSLYVLVNEMFDPRWRRSDERPERQPLPR